MSGNNLFSKIVGGSRRVNLTHCPWCFTKLTNDLIHCPVCGTGEILDPSVAGNVPAEPDLRVDSPKDTLKLLGAFKARYDKVKHLEKEYFNTVQRLSRTDPFLFNARENADVRNYPTNIQKACAWHAYTNLDPITDGTRGALFNYFSLYAQVAGFMSQNEIVGTGSTETARVEHSMKLIRQIDENTRMSFHLLADHLSMVSGKDSMSETAFSFLDRYYVNSFSIALKTLTEILRAAVELDLSLDETLFSQLGIPLRIFELETAHYMQLNGVPSAAMDIYQQTKSLAEYFAKESVVFSQALANDDLAFMINRFNNWSRPAINDLSDLDQRSRMMFGMFGPNFKL